MLLFICFRRVSKKYTPTDPPRFASVKPMSSLDFLEVEEDDADGEAILREREALRRRMRDVTFLDGMEEAKETTLQGGFDRGLSEGIAAGYSRGAVWGAISALHCWQTASASVNVGACAADRANSGNIKCDEGDLESRRQLEELTAQLSAAMLAPVISGALPPTTLPNSTGCALLRDTFPNSDVDALLLRREPPPLVTRTLELDNNSR
jgi:hypothetical protein